MASTGSHLLPLGSGIFIKKAARRDGAQGTDPHLILLFGWMAAKVPHLLKYVKAYEEIYPEATQIIIRSEVSSFWGSEKKRAASLAPVLEALELLGLLPPSADASTPSKSKLVQAAMITPIISETTPRILVHAFSNGGTWQMVTLGRLLSPYAAKIDTKVVTRPPAALILDSCPGNGGPSNAIRAFSAAIPNFFLRKLVALVILCLYAIQILAKKLRPHRLSKIDEMIAAVHNERLLPWFTRDTPRLYLYSTADELVPSDVVEKHASRSEELGLRVTKRRFEGSAHVAHAKMFPDIYWAAVRSLWDSAMVHDSDTS